MIRKLILGFCFLLAMFPASAFSLEGLSVESPREQVVVFIDGKQVCRPTYSCFIANLHGGLVWGGCTNYQLSSWTDL